MFRSATVVGNAPFTRELGRSLGDALVAELGQRPDACWLFCAPGDGIGDLVAAAHDVVRTRNFIGCTTDGEVSSAGFSHDSAVLTGIATDQINFQVASVSNIGRDSEWAGRELANALDRNLRHVQVLSDGMTGNGSAIARGLTSVLGTEAPISGGGAGDGRLFKQTWQFFGSNVVTDSAVAMSMSGNFEVGTGVRSGWIPAGVPKVVTRSKGNVVYEFDGQSALSVYRMYLGPLASQLPTVGVQFPFGIVDEKLQLGDDVILRGPIAVDEREGSVMFAGEVPEGCTMVLTTGGIPESLLQASGEAARRAIADLGDTTTPAITFLYSCMARRILLGRRTNEETTRVSSVVGKSVTVTGFYTYGEYCPAKRGGECVIHNETATVTVIGLPPRAF